MYLAYFDESGDDGYPKTSSQLFVLTSVYMHELFWKSNYNKIKEGRKKLKDYYGFPSKMEFHTKQFLTDKNPYRQFSWDAKIKKEILFYFFSLISTLDLKIINVVINKQNIIKPEYQVLENALIYNVQRIENDLNEYCKNCKIEEICLGRKFMIITDEGRVGKMRKTTRRIQSFNYIPSKYSGTYRKEIEKLIEDPIPKNSVESYFIQIADAIAYIVYLYALQTFNNSKWTKRVTNKIHYEDVIELLNKIKNRINLKANPQNEYGIVHYPKRV